MARAEIRREGEQAWLAVLLAWIAEGIDAIGFLTLFHLFTAHMSGNSAAMGAYFGQQRWGAALHRAFPIPLFVLGVALGTALTETALRRGARSVFAPALGLEAVLLIAFLVCGDRLVRHGTLARSPAWRFYALAALPVLAMGLQSATLRRVGRQRVRTTFVSGMLTNAAEEGVSYLFWLHDRTRGRPLSRFCRAARVSLRQASLNRMLLHASIWVAFVLGAILGGYAEARWNLRAVALSLCGLAFVLTVDLIRPTHTASREKSDEIQIDQ